MPILHAVKSLTPIPRANVAFDLGGHGKMDGMALVNQPEQVLERAKRTESEGKIGDVTWNVLKPAQRVVAFALYLPLLRLGARRVGRMVARLLAMDCCAQAFFASIHAAGGRFENPGANPAEELLQPGPFDL
jgi:hypothetical protein